MSGRPAEEKRLRITDYYRRVAKASCIPTSLFCNGMNWNAPLFIEDCKPIAITSIVNRFVPIWTLDGKNGQLYV